MKFKATTKAFLEGMQIVASIIPNRSPLPAVGYVKIQVGNQRVQLTAHDLHHQVQYSFVVEGTEDGAAIVPARMVLGFAKNLTTAEIQAETSDDGKNLLFTTGTIEFAVPTLPQEEFPVLPSEEGKVFKVDQATFRNALRISSVAMADDESRPILNGCLVHFADNQGRIVATDSRRLALAQFTPTVLPEKTEDIAFVLPAVAVKCLLSILTEEVEVTCRVSERRAIFEFATEIRQYRLSFSLLEGQFPNYSRFVQPIAHEHRISREPLLQALKRVGAVVENREGCVTLQFDPKQLQIKANTTCHYTEAIETDYSSDPILTMFNPKYIAQALEVIPDAQVVFGIAGSQAPLILQSHHYLYLAMPRKF